MTPLDQLAESIHAHDSSVAFCIDEKIFSYYDFRSAIGRIQGALLSQKLPMHSNIAFIANDDIETYASIFAILFLGHAFVPIHPRHPSERNRSILEQAEVKCLLTSNSENIPSLEGIPILTTSQALRSHEMIRVPLPPEQTAYILYTSGSTGNPKGVPISVGNLNSFLKAFFALGLSLDSHDRFLQMFDLTFDLSIMSYMVPLCIGASVFTVPNDVIKYTYVYNLMEKHELTVALMVPSILNGLKDYFPEISLPVMKYSLFCGEALYADVASSWSQCIPNATLINTYGPTEATIFCTYYTWHRNVTNKTLNGIVSIGKPMMFTETLIATEDDGGKGELCLAGAQVTRGYYKNASLDQKSFLSKGGHRYYRTGDLCIADEEGDLFYCGRLDFQLKINGFRVEPGEVEYHARTFLNTAVVVHANDSGGQPTLVLFAEGKEELLSGLKEYLSERVPSYMVPSKYIAVKSFPLNVNGKTDRDALMKQIY